MVAGDRFTEDDKVLVKTLWTVDGLSTREITALEPFSGRTRNSIIGLVHRLGLSGLGHSGAPWPRRPRAPRVAKPKAAPPAPRDRLEGGALTPLPMHIHTAGEHSVHLLQLSDSACKFSVGHATGADQLFCGKPAEGSWCAEHAPVVFAAPPTPNRRGDAVRLLGGLLSDRRRETAL